MAEKVNYDIVKIVQPDNHLLESLTDSVVTDVKNKKKGAKEAAAKRAEILVSTALGEEDEKLVQAQAKRAKEIAMHFRIRLPYSIRQLYCKQCKGFIVPGRTARVRIGRYRTRAVRISCLKCGHVYRRILPQGQKEA